MSDSSKCSAVTVLFVFACLLTPVGCQETSSVNNKLIEIETLRTQLTAMKADIEAAKAEAGKAKGEAAAAKAVTAAAKAETEAAKVAIEAWKASLAKVEAERQRYKGMIDQAAAEAQANMVQAEAKAQQQKASKMSPAEKAQKAANPEPIDWDSLKLLGDDFTGQYRMIEVQLYSDTIDKSSRFPELYEFGVFKTFSGVEWMDSLGSDFKLIMSKELFTQIFPFRKRLSSVARTFVAFKVSRRDDSAYGDDVVGQVYWVKAIDPRSGEIIMDAQVSPP